jgi:hypothetical protein
MNTTTAITVHISPRRKFELGSSGLTPVTTVLLYDIARPSPARSRA